MSTIQSDAHLDCISDSHHDSPISISSSLSLSASLESHSLSDLSTSPQNSDNSVSPLSIVSRSCSAEVKEALLIGYNGDVTDGDFELSVGFGVTMKLLPDFPGGTERVNVDIALQFNIDRNDVLQSNSPTLPTPFSRNDDVIRRDTDLSCNMNELDLRLFDSDELKEEFLNGLFESSKTSSPYFEYKNDDNLTKSDNPNVSDIACDHESDEDSDISSRLHLLLDLRHHDGPVVWCKISRSGTDSSLIISDADGNILDIPKNTSSRVQCGSDGSKYTLYISEPVAV